MSADIRIENHGSIVLARAETAAAGKWMKETAPDDAQWWGVPRPTLVIEPRYVDAFVTAAREDGLEVA